MTWSATLVERLSRPALSLVPKLSSREAIRRIGHRGGSVLAVGKAGMGIPANVIEPAIKASIDRDLLWVTWSEAQSDALLLSHRSELGPVIRASRRRLRQAIPEIRESLAGKGLSTVAASLDYDESASRDLSRLLMATIAYMLEHDRAGTVVIDGAPLALCMLPPDILRVLQDVCAAASRVNLTLVLVTQQAYSMPAPQRASETWLHSVSHLWLSQESTGATAGWLAAGGCHNVPETTLSTLRRQALFGTRAGEDWSFEAVSLA